MNEIDDSFKAVATAWGIVGLTDPQVQTDRAAASLSGADSPAMTVTVLDDLALDPDLLATTLGGEVQPTTDVTLDPTSHTAVLVAASLAAQDAALAGTEGELAPVAMGPELGALPDAPTQGIAVPDDPAAGCDLPTDDAGRIANPGLGWADLGILPGGCDLPVPVIDPLPWDWLPKPEIIATDSDGDGVVDTWTTPGSVIASDWDGDGVIDVQSTTADFVEQDRNGDGMIDTIWTSGDATEYDSDGDGRVDTWYHYTGWSQVDADYDGVLETWTDGTSLTETDTDGDGRVDAQTTNGVWSATDADSDGVSESWGYSGTITLSDTDHDGTFDQRVTSGGYREDDLDGDGYADRITWAGDVTETDSDADGVFDIVVKADDLGSYDYDNVVLDDPIVLSPIDPIIDPVAVGDDPTRGDQGAPDPTDCGFSFLPIDDVVVIDDGLGVPLADEITFTPDDGGSLICICWLLPELDVPMLV